MCSSAMAVTYRIKLLAYETHIFYYIFFFFLKGHRGWIYLIQNTVKALILWNIITIYNKCFLCEYLLKYNLFLWSSAIFRNHSNMRISCSRNIYNYYQSCAAEYLSNYAETVIYYQSKICIQLLKVAVITCIILQNIIFQILLSYISINQRMFSSK